MTLKAKLVLVLLAALGLYGTAYYAVQRTFLLPRFLELEEEDAEREIDRCRRVLENEVLRLDAACLEWARRFRWPTPADGAPVVGADALQRTRVDLVLVLDARGRTLWSEQRPGTLLTATALGTTGGRSASAEHPLLARPDEGGGLRGALATDRGLALVAVRPLDARSGHPAGRLKLVVARVLDDAAVAGLNSLTDASLRVWTVAGVPPALRGRLAHSGPRQFALDDSREDVLVVLAELDGIDSAAAGIVCAEVPRTILAQGHAAMAFTALSVAGTAVLLLTVLWLLVSRIVLAPIAQLTESVVSVAHDEDLSHRVGIDRRDELGTLAREFDRMLARLEESQTRMRHHALHDPLTGLPNRALLAEILARCLHRARSERGRRFALLFLDMDGFKGVNDTLGHDAGDELLVAIAERIESTLSRADLVTWDGSAVAARLGGDEFVVVLDAIENREQATEVATILVRELGKPYPIAGHSVTSLASVGISFGHGGIGTPEEMLIKADTAMYRAKRTPGSGRFEIFDSEV